MGHNRYTHGLIYLSAWVKLFYSKHLNTNITLNPLKVFNKQKPEVHAFKQSLFRII